MKKGMIAGTFDPPTMGHYDIIKRASHLCGKLLVVIMENSVKNPIFSVAERKRLLKKVFRSCKNIEVITHKGLVVDCAKENHIDVLFRGVRTASDMDYEFQMASSNRHLGKIETLVLFSLPEYTYLNATLIREIARGGRKLKGFVPEMIEDEVFKRLNEV